MRLFQIDAKDTGYSAPSFKDDDLFGFDVDNFYKMASSRLPISFPLFACSNILGKIVDSKFPQLTYSRSKLYFVGENKEKKQCLDMYDMCMIYRRKMKNISFLWGKNVT